MTIGVSTKLPVGGGDVVVTCVTWDLFSFHLLLCNGLRYSPMVRLYSSGNICRRLK